MDAISHSGCFSLNMTIPSSCHNELRGGHSGHATPLPIPQSFNRDEFFPVLLRAHGQVAGNAADSLLLLLKEAGVSKLNQSLLLRSGELGCT